MAVNIEQRITAAYEDERMHRHPPLTSDDLPFAYEDITPRWLTAVLCNKHPGAEVVSYRLDTPNEGTTSRRRIYVKYNAAGRDAGLPERVFCKASQSLSSRIIVGIQGCIQAEVNFYNKLRPQLSIEAPIAYFANYNAALNSLIMMNDIGETVTFCSHTTDITRERAEDQLRLLATLHGKFLDSPALKTTLAVFSTWPEFFRMMDYAAIEDACDQGFAASEEVIPPRLFARRKEIWPATRRSLECHQRLPHTLCHNDVHLRNWYIAANGRMGISDWQAATRGHWSRDFIYATTTALTVENRRLWEKELFQYYIDHLQQVAGRSVPLDGVFDACRQQLLTALAFWTITMSPAYHLEDVHPRDSILEIIRRIVTAIDDLGTLDSFS